MSNKDDFDNFDNIIVKDEEGNEFTLKLVHMCEFRGKGYGVFQINDCDSYTVFLLDGIEKDSDEPFDFVVVEDDYVIGAVIDIFEKETKLENPSI